MEQMILGIDVACRAAHQGSVADQAGRFTWSGRKFRTTAADLERLWESVPRGVALTVVMEPTRNAWVLLAAWFRRRGARVIMVPPEQSADLRDYYSKHAKSDRLDSRMLARLPLLHPEGLRPAEGLGPADAMRRAAKLRASLVKRRNVIVARLDSYLELLGPAWHAASGGDLALYTPLRFLAAGYAGPHALRRLGRARLARFIWRYSHGAWGDEHASLLLAAAAETLQLWDGELSYPDLAEDIATEARLALALCAEIRDLERKIAALLHQADPVAIMTSVPGVGAIGGTQILARLGDPARFRSLAGAWSFSGLVPSLTASGVNGHHGPPTKSGDAPLREALFMAANQARRIDPTLAARYHRLMVHQGKHHNSALCHISTALLTRIIACWRAGTPYQIRDLDGTPLTTAEGRAIVAGRYRISDELRAQPLTPLKNSTGWSSPRDSPAAAVAATASKPSCAAWACGRRTASPATPRSRGKSSGSSRPSRTGSPPNHPSPPPSPSSRPSWTPSPPSTTTSGPTGPCPTAPSPPPPTPPGRKPHPATAPPTPTTASAPTGVDAGGKVTLRADGRLHHIGIGAAHAQTPVLMLVQDLHIRAINAATGELLRDLTLDPTRNYQPTGRPPGPHPEHPAHRKTPDPNKGSGSFRCLATSQGALGGTRTPNLLIRSKMRLVQMRPVSSARAARRLCGQRAGSSSIQARPEPLLANPLARSANRGPRRTVPVYPGRVSFLSRLFPGPPEVAPATADPPQKVVFTAALWFACWLSREGSPARWSNWDGYEWSIQIYVLFWLAGLSAILAFGPTTGWPRFVMLGIVLYRLQELMFATLDNALKLTKRARQTIPVYKWPTPLLLSLTSIIQVVLIFAVAYLILTGQNPAAFSHQPISRAGEFFVSWISLPPLGGGATPLSRMARVLTIGEEATGLLLIVIAVGRFLSGPDQDHSGQAADGNTSAARRERDPHTPA